MHSVEEKPANMIRFIIQPCIGIARVKRWKRADGLGLHPPIEVLAVLLKEDAVKNIKSQRAHLDELMSSRFIID